jgi:hypothetical protein
MITVDTGIVTLGVGSKAAVATGRLKREAGDEAYGTLAIGCAAAEDL